MQDLLEYILKSLVSKPEEVVITESEEDNTLNFNVKVAQDDMGMVIGKSGQTIRSIRKLLVVRAMVENPTLRVNVNLEDSQKA